MFEIFFNILVSILRFVFSLLIWLFGDAAFLEWLLDSTVLFFISRNDCFRRLSYLSMSAMPFAENSGKNNFPKLNALLLCCKCQNHYISVSAIEIITKTIGT